MAQASLAQVLPRATRQSFRTPFAAVMPAIGDSGVEFDIIAREWRCKYTGPADSSASLKACQDLLAETLPKIKALADVKEVKRVVCGGCLDFKVVIAFPADKYDETVGGLEADFVKRLGEIEGVWRRTADIHVHEHVVTWPFEGDSGCCCCCCCCCCC